jgi:hypothetical protein
LDLHERSLQYVNTFALVIVTLINNIAVWTEIPPIELPSGIASISEINISDSGWLSCSYAARRMILWLPVERRGEALARHGRRVVVGARSGAVTVLELAT